MMMEILSREDIKDGFAIGRSDGWKGRFWSEVDRGKRHLPPPPTHPVSPVYTNPSFRQLPR